MGGDFNCTLAKSDSTGQHTFSRSLAALFQGYALTDAWKETSPRKTDTHTARGEQIGSHLTLTRPVGQENRCRDHRAAFTYHFAVALRLTPRRTHTEPRPWHMET